MKIMEAKQGRSGGQRALLRANEMVLLRILHTNCAHVVISTCTLHCTLHGVCLSLPVLLYDISAESQHYQSLL